jgi:hypothetical protein
MLGGTFQSNPTTAVTANLTAHAHDDNVWLGATWNSNAAGLFEGTFNTQARFGRTDRGEYVINIASDSSQAVINRSEWTLEPFMLSIEPDRINIEDLHFAHDANQYLSVDGTIAHSNADTLQVKLNNLDLGYLLSLVNLKGISFGGNVSGYLNAASLYTAEPYLDGRLTAQDFSFCGGPMGDMQAQLQWNQDSTCLEFVALLNETPDHTTVVDGTVYSLLLSENKGFWLAKEGELQAEHISGTYCVLQNEVIVCYGSDGQMFALRRSAEGWRLLTRYNFIETFNIPGETIFSEPIVDILTEEN